MTVTTLPDILVLGLGASGTAAARYCARRIGSEFSSVTVIDSADDEKVYESATALRELGVNVLTGVSDVAGTFDTCIVSPGIAPHTQIHRSAVRACAEMISEIEFAFRCSNTAWVAVTGTNGKTTTTALVAHLLETGGVAARAVGNIGTPAIEAVEQGDARVLVAEVSSFQLASTVHFRPRVAVLLNITPDHIDWHGSLESYSHDKAKVFANMGAGDTAVIDVDDPGSAAFAPIVERSGVHVVRVSREAPDAGATVVDGRITVSVDGEPVRLLPTDQLLIRGPHNVSNALAATAAARAMGVDRRSIEKGLATFAPIAHRLEPAGEACGVRWFNDSKATNPDAVLKAIDSFGSSPVVLLLGGRNKGNSFDQLAEYAVGRIRSAITFGEAGEQIADAMERHGVDTRRCDTMLDAIDSAACLASQGDVVVLSPACASFDEFTSYGHRGEVFKSAVAAMVEGGCR